MTRGDVFESRSCAAGWARVLAPSSSASSSSRSATRRMRFCCCGAAARRSGRAGADSGRCWEREKCLERTRRALSDRIGRRPVLIAGLARVCADLFPVRARAAHGSVAVVRRVRHRLRAHQGTELALVADVAPEIRRGAAFGWYYLAIWHRRRRQSASMFGARSGTGWGRARRSPSARRSRSRRPRV